MQSTQNGRKISMDLNRLKNFPSTLSLRKPEDSAASGSSPPSGAFSRIRNFKQQGQLRRERSTKQLASNMDSPTQSSTSTYSPESKTTAASQSSIFRRGSRLLDAFKSSPKPTPTFEVVRKVPHRTSTVTRSSQAEENNRSTRMSGVSFDLPEAAPRLSLSTSRSNGVAKPLTSGRPPYPSSNSNTRKPSSATQAALDSGSPILHSNSSGTVSPSGSPQPDTQRRSFSLHSFRNVRADRQESDGHSRRQSMISADEFATPKEELSEPSFYPDTATNGLAVDDTTIDANRARPVSPSVNDKPAASMSAARFRQAARQRSESGNVPTLDTIANGSTIARPPRSRTPSRDLAMMESVLAQTSLRSTQPVAAVNEDSVPTSTQLNRVASPLPVKKRRGVFIVVEGLDRAGKSTQVERLAAQLNAKAIKFPERTTAIGVMINAYLAQTSDLDDQAIHLLFSANRWESVASIRAAIEDGQNVVCDRYAFSGIAYSVAKGLSYDWCRNPDVGLPLPDLTMFLDLDAETAAARGGYGEERYEKLEFQAKVREAFGRVSQDVRAHGGRWATIDASKTLEQVTEEIQKTVYRATSCIDRTNGATVGKLFVASRPGADRSTSSKDSIRLPTHMSSNRSSPSLDQARTFAASPDMGRSNATATSSGSFATARPISPLGYAEQLAAVRTAATGTLSGFFNGSNTHIDQMQQQFPGQQQRQLDGPSPSNSQRGQGIDSARLLANYQDGNKRRTLVDVIGQLENGQDRKALHRRSISATPEEQPSGLAIGSAPSHARRSTDTGRPSVDFRSTASPEPSPLVSIMSDSRRSMDGGRNGTTAETTRPSLMKSSSRPSQSSGEANVAVPRVSFNLSRDTDAGAPPRADSNGGGGVSPSAQQMAMRNAQQTQAEMQEHYMRNYMAMMQNPMLAQQAQYQMMLQQQHQQQQYYRAAAGMTQSDVGGGVNTNSSGSGSANGAQPTAAFMQPDVAFAAQEQMRRERRSSRQRTMSSGSLANNASQSAHLPQQQQAQQQQPMLSMMMAPPPPMSNASTAPNSPLLQAQQMFYQQQQQQQQQQMMYQQQMQYGQYAQRPFYRNTAHSEVVLPTIYAPNSASTTAARKSSASNLRTQRSMDRGLRKAEPSS